MFRRLIFKFNRWLGWYWLPIASITNDIGSESYTLRNDGWVIVRSTAKDAGLDAWTALPLCTINEYAQARFAEQIS